MMNLDLSFLYKDPTKHFSFDDEKLLKMLLQFSSTEPEALAQQLLRQYRNIANLMDADLSSLSAIEGLDEGSALLLQLVPELHRRYFLSRNEAEVRLIHPSDFGQYLLPYFYGERNEVVYLLMLDASCKVINCLRIGEGSVNSANVPIRRLVQEAINANATGIVIAHNHPSGIAIPSKEDVDITHRLKASLEIMELTLLDHLIIADDDFVSLWESGYL